MALRTGIAPDAWERAGGRHIATAFELLAEQDKQDRQQSEGDTNRVLSG